jgi:two-component system, OmpR family, sensor histidine kinase VicK
MSPSRSKATKKEDTMVLYGVDNVINTVLQFLNQTNDIINACVDYSRPSLAIEIDVLKEAFLKAKKRGVRLRYVTEITSDNISYCKQLLTMVDELRHLNGIKGNLYIGDTAYIAPATFHEKGKPASQIIYSNVKEIIEHQSYLFETLWSKAIPATERIKDIEEGLASEFYEVISDHEKATQTIVDLAKSVKKEALFFLPNDKAMVRAERLGLIDNAVKASQSGAIVKIICPLSEVNAKIVKKISEKAPKTQVLNGNNSPYGMYIADGEKFIRAELRNPSAEKFSESVGFMVYSNRKTSVESFKSIFELLWNERTLNEELLKTYKMQKEFINIVSHEMKTPTQAILGYSELLEQHPENNSEIIASLKRNASRLQRLTNDILELSRIESQTLRLNKEKVNMNEKIRNVINDVKGQIHNPDKLKIAFSETKYPIYVQADKTRLYQVIANLLTNAIKFTEEGTISISTNIKDNNNELIVTVTDTGEGIHSDILPRLFTKFATKSNIGTGLGLYISKNIVASHGGKMWAENNSDGRGATFSFSLPVTR